MTHMISLSEEELGEVQNLLEQELQECKPEFRRTRSHGYKDKLRHHVQVTQHILEVVRRARTEGSPTGQEQ
ncbi:MAG: hypothetical protein ACLFVU_01155 [Phycisphaerae bacterium]